MRYLNSIPKKDLPEGARLVHNFFPGPADDPGRDRTIGDGGFRVWITDEPMGERCYCGWAGGREHYGTRAHVSEDGTIH